LTFIDECGSVKIEPEAGEFKVIDGQLMALHFTTFRFAAVAPQVEELPRIHGVNA
jgi:hypothetical protein